MNPDDYPQHVPWYWNSLDFDQLTRDYPPPPNYFRTTFRMSCGELRALQERIGVQHRSQSPSDGAHLNRLWLTFGYPWVDHLRLSFGIMARKYSEFLPFDLGMPRTGIGKPLVSLAARVGLIGRERCAVADPADPVHKTDPFPYQANRSRLPARCGRRRAIDARSPARPRSRPNARTEHHGRHT